MPNAKEELIAILEGFGLQDAYEPEVVEAILEWHFRWVAEAAHD